MSIFIFKRKRPAPLYAFFMGAVMEVFHMYAVLITHRADMKMAHYVVRICSGPMIVFTGIGLALSSILLQMIDGEWKNPFRKQPKEEKHVSEHFEFWLFIVISFVFLVNFAFSYTNQTQTAVQNAHSALETKAANIEKIYQKIVKSEDDMETIYYAAGSEGAFDIIKQNGAILEGNHKLFSLSADLARLILGNPDGNYFEAAVFNRESICRTDDLGDDMTLLTLLPLSDIYEDREIHALETLYADILLMSAVYVLISFLVQQIVVNNLDLVNASLNKITQGDLNEVVNVRSSSEFASFSDGINQTVDVLKGYIDAAEKRIEQELKLASTIQDSALPKNFNFSRKDFEIYAVMDPAKEIGGDFYDFFFIGSSKLALVIADVSGKGIPASLFMMRSMSTISGLAEEGKSPSEIFFRANNLLCEGNDAEMFVTVWIGIVDLETGLMKCANAGHEYPALMRAGGEFELLKDKHSLALAAMPNVHSREYELQLNPGDRLFVYTDGLPEAINVRKEQYGKERMLRILNTNRDRSMAAILPAVRGDVSDFVGDEEQFDDLTMLGFTYYGSNSE